MQTHPEAQNKLGECYLYGRGVERDSLEALYWFVLSSALGSDQGGRNWNNLNQVLSGEQKDLVYSRTDVWFEEHGLGMWTSHPHN